MTGKKRLNDVNLIPKKEAITYLESRISRGDEEELARILIELIELDLVEAVYDDGYVAYQAIKIDPFTAFVNIWSTKSEQEIKTILPELRKITEKYKEKLKTPFKKGMISEPLIEILKTVSGLEVLKNGSNLTAYKPSLENLLEKCYKKGYLSKEVTSKILDFLLVLSFKHETRISNTKINEIIIEIKKLLEEEERKIMEQERWTNQFIELFEKFSNHSVPEVKRILSEVRNQLEEK